VNVGSLFIVCGIGVGVFLAVVTAIVAEDRLRDRDKENEECSSH
jgi:hypothetical protein